MERRWQQDRGHWQQDWGRWQLDRGYWKHQGAGCEFDSCGIGNLDFLSGFILCRYPIKFWKLGQTQILPYSDYLTSAPKKLTTFASKDDILSA